VWELHLDTLHNEPDKIVVARTCSSISAMVEWGGRPCFQPEAEIMGPLCDALVALLNKKATCQGDLSDEEDDDDEEFNTDHDDALIDTVTECATSVGQCFGADFVDYLPHFLKALLAYTQPHRPELDRSMGIGACAEFLQNANTATQSPVILPLLPELATNLCSCLDDAHEPVRRNAAYCAGVLCLHAGAASDAFLPTILEKLAPLTRRDGPAADATVDNAAGALARILTRLGPEAVASNPASADLVNALFAAVPIKEDFAETVMVTDALICLAAHPATSALCSTGNHSVQLALAMVGAVAAGQVLPGENGSTAAPKEGALPPALYEQAVGLLQKLVGSEPACAAAAQGALNRLVPESRHMVEAHLQRVLRLGTLAGSPAT
jgi:hypothetical protein